ncbi:MAG: DUF4230 domain-containing protein, partial [Kiritimatiellae bacterium]|nr:DUF4230 domain-containing protein [Kiritimatiellia bacterium]
QNHIDSRRGGSRAARHTCLMRKILTRFTIVPITLLAVAALAAGGLLAFLAWRDREAVSFASSVVSENSPIAELATRKIVWKVVHIGSTVSTDTVRETVYTIKAGYDLSQAETPVVDKEAKTVTLTLPPPKILSIDHFLQRESFERKTLVERVFGENRDDGKADREDIVQLASDCDKFALLSAENLRESVVALIANRLRDVCGYELVVQAGLDIPAKVMFNAYFEEKGVDFRLP